MQIRNKPIFPTSDAALGASLNIPHGTAPSAPVNGDVWTTSAGMFVRVNGVTVGPLVGVLPSLSATAGAAVIASVSGTWYDAGCGLSLPAGVWLYTATVRSWLAQSTAGGTLRARLNNSTTGVAIANSETRLAYGSVAGVDYLNTTTLSMVVTVAALNTVRLEISRTTAGVYTVSQTQSDANGRTRANAVRIG